MNILFTGHYIPDYNRTLIIKEGLKNFDHIQIKEYPFNKLPAKNDEFYSLIDWSDKIFLPPFAHKTAHLMKKITRKEIIFDPVVSIYMSKVFDFKKYSKYSPRALKRYLYDWRAFHSANRIFYDTNAHKQYISKTFGIKHAAQDVLYIGVSTNEFFPIRSEVKEKQKIFKVGFYGSFLPLQGVNRIIEAAKILKDDNDIQFDLVGTGWKLDEAKAMAGLWGLNNIHFSGWIDYADLNEKINSFDLCLGVFGDSIKTNVVIPNKIYHYAACNKCILTKQTIGMNEIFTNEKDVMYTDATPQDLAEKILYLKNNPVIKNTIAAQGYQLITTKYNQVEIAKSFIASISK